MGKRYLDINPASVSSGGPPLSISVSCCKRNSVQSSLLFQADRDMSDCAGEMGKSTVNEDRPLEVKTFLYLRGGFFFFSFFVC